MKDGKTPDAGSPASGEPVTDNFEGFFRQALGVDDPSAAKDNPAPDAHQNDNASGLDTPEKNVTDDGGVPGTPSKKDGPPDGDPPTPEDWEQKYKTLQGMFNKLKDEKAAPPPETPAPPPPRQQLDYSPLFKDLTKAIPKELREGLEDYEHDWDQVAKYEGAKRDEANKRILDYVHELFSIFTERLQPYIKATERATLSARDMAVIRKHDDFEALRDSGDLKAWIGTKPGFLKEPMERVLESDVPEDIIDLVSQFKLETKEKAPPSKDTPAKQPGETVDEKLKKLQVVPNKTKGVQSSGVPGAGEPGDFSTAFQEALQKFK